MCLSETDSYNKQKKMTSERPRHVPTITSTTRLDEPTTRSGLIRSSTHHDVLDGALRIENPQEFYRQHRDEHRSGGGRRGPPTRSRTLGIRPAARPSIGVTGTSSTAREDRDYDDERGNYTHLPVSVGGARSSVMNLPIRGGREGRDRDSDRDHDRDTRPYNTGTSPNSYYDLGTSPGARSNNTAGSTNRDRPASSSFQGQGHPAHRHRERHSLRVPKERVTTYIQDNVIMRIPSGGSSLTAETSDIGLGIGHLSSSNSDTHGGRSSGNGSGADHRRKWYRERMARIIQDIEPGLPPSGSGSGAGSAGYGRGSTSGGGRYVYSGMGGGSGAGGYSGGGSGSGGYAGAGSHGAGPWYGTNGTNGSTSNARDSGYESGRFYDH
ncbi:hypothetical protein B0T20DRAFT_392210 [Sordaria brevicollis]|uniref:Uncharacterized protein n=1 Tax=Sordaria brevicollis TaxID=83679 RepID=A0AAE0PFV6_SORBR|nr:hypothetical protein B0T20DRAFT_392210 [Sordaria brevicollis]